MDLWKRADAAAPTGHCKLRATLALSVLVLLLSPFCVRTQCTGDVTIDALAGFISSDFWVVPPEPSMDLRNPEDVVPGRALNPPTPDTQCTWLIYYSGQVQEQNITDVYLTFQSFELAVGDTLDVYEGSPDTGTVLLKSFNASDNGFLPANLHAASTFMYVVFNGGPTGTGAGFGAYFQAGGCMYAIAELTRTFNTITSGTNPLQPYADKENSGFWIHSLDPAGIISLTYIARVESGYDFLSIYDGKDALAPRLAITQFDNTTSSAPILSTTSSMYISWTSDKSTGILGWIIDYEITYDFCSGVRVLNSSSGVFSDESSDSGYLANSNCGWLIQPTNPVNSIDLFFLNFALAEEDFVHIYDGVDSNGQLLASYTGFDIPKHISFAGNVLFVQFVSSPQSSTAQGFTAVYHAGSCIVTSRIGAAEGTSGWITDGSGNSTYHDYQDCTWLFQVDSLSQPPPTISFEFVQFDLEWHFDQVTVYDGSSVNSPVIFSYTGSVDTSTTTLSGRTTGASMLVRFTTDFSNGGNGWNMTFVANLPVEGDGDDKTGLIIGLTVGITVPLCCLLLLLLIVVALFVYKLRSPRLPREDVIELREPNFSDVTWTQKKSKRNKDQQREGEEAPGVSLSDKQIKVLDKFMLNGTVAFALAEATQESKLLQLKSIAEAMVTIYQKNDRAAHLLEHLILYELESSEEENMLFKDTLATRSFVAFGRIVGMPYLWSLFATPIYELNKRNAKKSKKDSMRTDSFFELDTNVEVGDEDEEERSVRVLEIQVVLQKLLARITSSVDEFPLALRYLLYRIYIKVRSRFPDQADVIMGNLVFQRFICPVFEAPAAYGILKSTPHPSTQKSLLLISRVFRNLGREDDFAEEPAMEPLNDFLHENSDKIQTYLTTLCGCNRKPLVGDPPSSVVPGSAMKAAREVLYGYVSSHAEDLESKLREFPTYKIHNAIRWLSYLSGDEGRSIRSNVSDLEDLSDTENSEKIELVSRSDIIAPHIKKDKAKDL